MTTPQFVNSIGLVSDMIGAFLFARGIFVKNELLEQIKHIGRSAYGYEGTDYFYKQAIDARRDGTWGLIFLVAGFAGQLLSQFL